MPLQFRFIIQHCICFPERCCVLEKHCFISAHCSTNTTTSTKLSQTHIYNWYRRCGIGTYTSIQPRYQYRYRYWYGVVCASLMTPIAACASFRLQSSRSAMPLLPNHARWRRGAAGAPALCSRGATSTGAAVHLPHSKESNVMFEKKFQKVLAASVGANYFLVYC